MTSPARTARYVVAAAGIVLIGVAAWSLWRADQALRRVNRVEALLDTARGEALVARGELAAERRRPYEAYAIGRALASGTHGPAVAERARSRLMADMPHRAREIAIPGEASLSRLSFVPGGVLIGSGREGEAIAWDVRTGDTVEVPDEVPAAGGGGDGRVRDAAGGRTARASGASIRVTDDGSGEVLAELEVEGSPFSAVALSPDGSVVCAGTRDGRLLARPLTGAPYAPVAVGGGAVTRVVAFPQVDEGLPTFLVVTSNGAVAKYSVAPQLPEQVPQLDAPEPIQLHERLLPRGAVVWAATRSDGTAVIAYANGELVWWRGEQRLRGPAIGSALVPRTILELDAGGQLRAAALSPDEQTVALLMGQSLWLVDLEPGLLACDPPSGDGSAVVAAAESASALAVARGRRVVVCDVDRRRRSGEVIELSAPPDRIALSNNGRRLLTVVDRGPATVWDADGTRVSDLGELSGGALSSDGTRVVGRTSGGTWFLADADTGHPVELSCLEGAEPDQLALVPGQGGIVAVARDHHVVLCDEDGDERTTLGTMPAGAWNARVSPDGAVVWSAGEDQVRLWDARSGELLQTLRVGGGVGLDAAVAPGGRHVLTSDDDGRRLWDLETGEVVLRRDPREPVMDGPGPPAEVFTGDGAFLVVVGGTRAGALSAYDARSGEPLPRAGDGAAAMGAEAARRGSPLGSGPDVLVSSVRGYAVFHLDRDAGPEPLVHVEPGDVAVGEHGRWLVWGGHAARVVPVGRDAADVVALTADVSNHRVCRDSFDVVAVPPEALDDPIWAPADVCPP